MVAPPNLSAFHFGWLREEVDKPPPLRPGKVAPMLEVPPHIPRPPYADSGRMPDWDPNPQIHDAAGVEKMRAAGRLAAQVCRVCVYVCCTVPACA